MIQCVGQGFGVRLQEDGSVAPRADTGVDGQVNAVTSWWGKLFTQDPETFRQQLVDNFKRDLGEAFITEEEEPAPNFALTKCLYHDVSLEGGAPALTDIFWCVVIPVLRARSSIKLAYVDTSMCANRAEHRAAFASIDTFHFDGHYSRGPTCYFRFGRRGNDLPPERLAKELQERQVDKTGSC